MEHLNLCKKEQISTLKWIDTWETTFRIHRIYGWNPSNFWV